ncbi:MAG: response regulator transcription factor [Rhodobacteraceae bacterium]|nr:MAG: response regulator transcription factor [Paracoccaceae bacterium]
MNILIVESRAELGQLWQRHLERQGNIVTLSADQDTAIDALCRWDFDIIVLDLVLDQGSALAVSDFASYRRPEAQVIFVTNTTFFSDGSIFAHSPNACAFVPSTTPPEDLAAMIDYHAAPRAARSWGT